MRKLIKENTLSLDSITCPGSEGLISARFGHPIVEIKNTNRLYT